MSIDVVPRAPSETPLHLPSASLEQVNNNVTEGVNNTGGSNDNASHESWKYM